MNMKYLFCSLLVLASVSACAQPSGAPAPSSVSSAPVVVPALPQSLEFAGEAVPLDNYDTRESLLRELMSCMYLHSRTTLTLLATTRYFPVIEPIMKKYGIPTARYEVFDKPEEALAYIRQTDRYPAVVKADGLALGKGVILCDDYDAAKEAIHSIMEDRIFGASGSRVVVEEFLTGPEVSVLAFTDGKTIRPMVSAKDHKRAFDGDLGPNTGGMGTISPNPYYSAADADWCMEHIFQPTIEAMNQEGRPFKGCLFFGLMLTPDGPKVIEYNCRFGDPETQVVLPRLRTDLIEILEAIREERLADLPIEWAEEACACVVMASGGYPAAYRKGLPITGLDAQGQCADAEVFHAGTAYRDGRFVTNGGRVLGVTARGSDVEEALRRAYTAVETIDFENAHYRRDIGKTR